MHPRRFWVCFFSVFCEILIFIFIVEPIDVLTGGKQSIRGSANCTCSSTPSTPTAPVAPSATTTTTTSTIKKLYNIIHPSSLTATATSSSLPLNNHLYNQFPSASASSSSSSSGSSSNQLLTNNLNELSRSSSSKLYNKPFTLSLTSGGLQHSKMRRSISKDSIDDKHCYWGASVGTPHHHPPSEGGAGSHSSNPSHAHLQHSFHLHPHSSYHHHHQLYSSDGLPCSLIYRGATGGSGGTDSLPPQIEDYLKSSSSLLKNLNTSVSVDDFLYLI